MKIDRISYQKVFPVGSYLTERISFEASLDEGETPQDAINQMRQMAEDLHREKFPHYYADGIDPKHREEPFIQLREEESAVDKAEDTPEWKRWLAITAGCFSVDQLQKFKTKCPQPIYEARLKFLEGEAVLEEQIAEELANEANQ
jgi:hypothetical protein